MQFPRCRRDRRTPWTRHRLIRRFRRLDRVEVQTQRVQPIVAVPPIGRSMVYGWGHRVEVQAVDFGGGGEPLAVTVGSYVEV